MTIGGGGLAAMYHIYVYGVWGASDFVSKTGLAHSLYNNDVMVGVLKQWKERTSYTIGTPPLPETKGNKGDGAAGKAGEFLKMGFTCGPTALVFATGKRRGNPGHSRGF